METANLILRDLNADDADNLFQSHRDKEVMQYLQKGEPFTYERTVSKLNYLLKHKIKFGYAPFGVIQKQGNLFIGICGFLEPPTEPDLVCILNKNYWGNGLGFEASSKAIQYMFSELKYTTLWGSCRQCNARAINLYKSLGMKFNKAEELRGENILFYKITSV